MHYDFSLKVCKQNGKFVHVITFPNGDQLVSDESWPDKDCAYVAMDRFSPKFADMVHNFAVSIEADSVEEGCAEEERGDTR